MTLASQTTSPPARSLCLVRTGLWLVHTALLIFGAVTILLGVTDRWLALPGYPDLARIALPLLYLASLAGFTLLVGPKFRGLHPVAWAAGTLPTRYAWLFLLPSAFLLIPLTAATVRFFRLLWQDRLDNTPLPIAGILLLAILAWLLLALRWLRIRPLLAAPPPPPPRPSAPAPNSSSPSG